jgi:hypothetical protein
MFCAMFCAILIMSLAASIANAAEIGMVKSSEGNVDIRNLAAQRYPASVGVPVNTGDLVRTGEGAFAEIALLDNSILQVTENASLVVDKFTLNEPVERHLSARFIKGAFRYTADALNLATDKREIKLGAAVMGIRGTDFFAVLGNPSDQGSGSGYTVGLISGDVQMKLQGKEIVLNKKNMVITATRGGQFDPPVLLSNQEMMALAQSFGFKLDLGPDEAIPPQPERCENARQIGGIKVCDVN